MAESWKKKKKDGTGLHALVLLCPSAPGQSGAQNSMRNTCVCDQRSLSGCRESPNPSQLAAPTGSRKRFQVFGRISASIWLRSASGWGVLAVCEHVTPKPLETRVHEMWLCSFEHSTFASITFDTIQRNLIQPCFKARFLAFLCF